MVVLYKTQSMKLDCLHVQCGYVSEVILILKLSRPWQFLQATETTYAAVQRELADL